MTAVDRASKFGMLRSLGADEVVDYTREDFTRRGVRCDFIVDVPGDRPFSDVWRALEPDGEYVPIGHDSFGTVGRRLFGLIPHFLVLIFLSLFRKRLRLGRSSLPSKQESIAILADLLEGGKITPVLDSTYPLAETGGAFRHMMEDETIGKVMLSEHQDDVERARAAYQRALELEPNYANAKAALERLEVRRDG